jgi:hypothetical protein
MRAFALPYSSALILARESRPLISPNAGFERQLRIWEHCRYHIYLAESTSSPGSAPKEKAAYKAWKSERDILLKRGEEAVNKARFSSMASMAAEFGKRRLEVKDKIKNQKEEQGEIENEEEKTNRASWEKVEKMEEEWTRRLITGEKPWKTERKEM